MMYLDDAVRATIELMEVSAENIKIRSSYNSFYFIYAKEIMEEIKRFIPGFETSYNPDFRQIITDSWPGSIDDSDVSFDWGWEPYFNLKRTVNTMLENLKHLRPVNKVIY